MLAVLSNINCDPVIRKVSKFVPCVENVGYGNILEALLNPASNISTEKPSIVVIVVDTREFIQNASDYLDRIISFFSGLQNALRPGVRYYISDSYYHISFDGDYKGTSIPRRASILWDQHLYEFVDAHSNCYIFPLRNCIEDLGGNAFYSDKAWSLGSIRYSKAGIDRICQEIQHVVNVCAGKIKKVIALDLDNTLWGGVVGEDGPEGVKLADSGVGKAYKDFQSSLLYMKDCGAALTIVSKNNEADAWEVIDNHPHMLIHKEDLSAYRINWNSKAENIKSIAKEMNIGLNSIVFVDDNPLEQQEIRELLPDVTVPDFPAASEELPKFGKFILENWFKRNEITREDREKTRQYQVMHEIAQAQLQATDFSSFLEGLQIKLIRQNPSEHLERVTQLVQKTNQFNTTVTRYSQNEIENMLTSNDWRIYLYGVEDRFANHGLCAEAFVHIDEKPIIENFIMSCRVMGRNIEYGILRDIEEMLKEEGYSSVGALFRKGPKNMPVESLYEQAGYTCINTEGFESSDVKEYTKVLTAEDHEQRYFGEVIKE